MTAETPSQILSVARLAESSKVGFGPQAFYRRLLGGAPLPVVTGVQTCLPGYATVVHSHPYVEVLFVIEGEAAVWIHGRDDEAVRLGPGDTVAVPAGVWHGFRNAGDKELNMLGIHCSPQRDVRYIDGQATGADGYASYDARGRPT